MAYIIVFGVIILVAAIYYYKDKAESREKADNTIGGSSLDRFFIECVLAECVDFSLQKNVEKAKLLAQKYGLKFPNGIETLFLDGFETHKRCASNYNTLSIASKRTEMVDLLKELTKYAELTGRDKPIRMLSDEYQKQLAEEKKAADAAKYLLTSTQQKTINSGIVGGAMEAIGGLGAGVMAAASTEIDNARIKEENKIRMKAALESDLYNYLTNKAYSGSSDQIKSQLNTIKEKRCEETNADNILSALTIETIDLSLVDDGSVTLEAEVTQKEELFLYGDVPGYADGTILARIKENDREIGAMKLVLPTYGTKKSPVRLRGLLLGEAKQGNKYTVTYAPYKLWLMEK